MRRWAVLLVLAAAGAGIALILIPSEEDPAPVPQPATQAQKEPRCPRPQVTDLTARRASENGHRVKLHVSAETERGRIGGFSLRWGDGQQGALLFQGGARRLSFPLTSHYYRKEGTYRIRVVVEAASSSCGDMKSEPATLSVRIPLR